MRRDLSPGARRRTAVDAGVVVLGALADAHGATDDEPRAQAQEHDEDGPHNLRVAVCVQWRSWPGWEGDDPRSHIALLPAGAVPDV